MFANARGQIKACTSLVQVRRMNVLNTDSLLMVVASLLLLVVNWLAFHDFREAHSMRDWLMLLASVLVFVQFAREFRNRNLGHR